MSATGDAAEDHQPAQACLDCGTVLVGPHCHACGQRAELHRSAGAVLHDLLHGALHFEGRVWHTLPLLVRDPGRLTREYINGRRTTYIGPVALFLFSVFVMFAALQIGELVEPDLPAVAEAPAAATDAADRLDIDRTGWALLDKTIAKTVSNPTLMAYKLQSNSYKFSWLLIPLSLPFVALLFAWHRRFGLYDHAVFVTYSLCFMSLLAVALWVLGWLGLPGGLQFLVFVLLPPVHIYRQLRGAYQLRRRSALWRTGALLAFIPLILAMFLLIQVVLGAAG